MKFLIIPLNIVSLLSHIVNASHPMDKKRKVKKSGDFVLSFIRTRTIFHFQIHRHIWNKIWICLLSHLQKVLHPKVVIASFFFRARATFPTNEFRAGTQINLFRDKLSGRGPTGSQNSKTKITLFLNKEELQVGKINLKYPFTHFVDLATLEMC